MDFFKPKIKPASSSSCAGPAALSLTPPPQPPAKRLRDDNSAAFGPYVNLELPVLPRGNSHFIFEMEENVVFSLNGLSSMIGWNTHPL